MAEIELRESKTLKALSQLAEPARPSDIAKVLGDIPLNIGNSVRTLAKSGLAELVNKKGNTWSITDKGKETLANLEGNPETATLLQQAITAQQEPPPPPEPPVTPPAETPPQPTRKPLATPPAPPEEEIIETVPSQADLFKAEGQRIGFGTRKGDIKLEAVVNYVERIADLDDLGSVWNALTEMGVATDVKKRWIKLYAQNLPGKEIPAELKAKLETGTEAEKVSTEKEPPRAKRFNVIDGQIMPDDEGEYSFSMAVQKAMVEKGASSNQAAEMATTFAKMNTDTMNILIPLLTKEPGGDAITKLLIPLLTKDTGGDTITKLLLTQMSDLQKEMRSGQGSSEATQQVQALSQQLDQLRDTLHNEQLLRIQEQNQAIQEQNQARAKEMVGYMGRLEKRIEAITEGKQVESKIGLMSKALDAGAEQLSGIRQDLKPLAQSFMERGAAPGEKTATEKKGFGTGLDKGMERAREAAQLENELFFTGGPSSE